MRITATTARRLFLLGFAAALLTAIGCSGGGGENGGTTIQVLTCRDGGAAAENDVAMDCGAATAAVTKRIDVVMGGPASGTTTLSGLNFDVTYDPSKLEFVSVDSSTSELFPPGALVLAALYNGQPGRVVVSIQQAGGVPDVAVGTGQHVALSLSFRRVSGTTFPPTPLAFDPTRSEATNASTTVSFSSGLTLAYQ